MKKVTHHWYQVDTQDKSHAVVAQRADLVGLGSNAEVVVVEWVQVEEEQVLDRLDHRLQPLCHRNDYWCHAQPEGVVVDCGQMDHRRDVHL
jgi:hypothetical protein